ncbi:hypothetical protein BG004_007674 [Podila humilis]|nr:hypothetical protein BG004_007674 [Podila humilis]
MNHPREQALMILENTFKKIATYHRLLRLRTFRRKGGDPPVPPGFTYLTRCVTESKAISLFENHNFTMSERTYEAASHGAPPTETSSLHFSEQEAGPYFSAAPKLI